MNPEMNYKILLCDDEFANFQHYIDIASCEDVELVCLQTWQEAKKELDNNWNIYSAIILDFKGQVDYNSKTTDPKHLNLATRWLAEQNAIGKYFPFFIYTAHEVECKNYFADDYIIYSKTLSFIDVIIDIKKNIYNTKNEKIKRKYKEFFLLKNLDKIIEAKDIAVITDLLSNLEDNKYEAENFNTIRKIFESILKKANRIDRKMLPDECIKENQNPNLTWSCRYLANKELTIKQKDGKQIIFKKGEHEIANIHVSACIRLTSDLSSTISHHYKQPYTINAYRTCLFALLEFIIWFVEYVQEKYPQNFDNIDNIKKNEL